MRKKKKAPTNAITPELAKKYAQLSAEKRRNSAAERKKLKTTLEILLELPCKDREEINNQAAIAIALVEKAKKGDIRAFEVIRDTIGQKPVEQAECLQMQIKKIFVPAEMQAEADAHILNAITPPPANFLEDKE